MSRTIRNLLSSTQSICLLRTRSLELTKLLKKVNLKKQDGDEVLIRHPDHVKPFYGRRMEGVANNAIHSSSNASEADLIVYNKQEEDNYDNAREVPDGDDRMLQEDPAGPLTVRRSTRERRPNPRYANDDYVSGN